MKVCSSHLTLTLTLTLTLGTDFEAKFEGGIVDMEWVYRFVHTHLHGLGKPVPLEFDRHKWCTSRNLRKYYDIIRDAALEHGLAVKNDSFVPGVPYTEEIYWTKPGCVCEMDEPRPAAATGALRSIQAAHRQRPAGQPQSYWAFA